MKAENIWHNFHSSLFLCLKENRTALPCQRSNKNLRKEENRNSALFVRFTVHSRFYNNTLISSPSSPPLTSVFPFLTQSFHRFFHPLLANGINQAFIFRQGNSWEWGLSANTCVIMSGLSKIPRVSALIKPLEVEKLAARLSENIYFNKSRSPVWKHHGTTWVKALLSSLVFKFHI